MSATADPPVSTRARTRRSILAGALGGAGALAVGAIGHVAPARATQGEAVLAGQENTAEYTTTITNTVEEPGRSGLQVTAADDSIIGRSLHSVGVVGESDEQYGVWGSGPSVGVHGSGGVRGVDGSSQTGDGVFGWSNTGAGVHAVTGSGYALRTDGRIKAEKVSGVATISAGSTSKTVSPGVNVTSGSFLLLTAKVSLGGRDLWYTTNSAANTFTIRMSRPRSSSTKVAWLLLG